MKKEAKEKNLKIDPATHHRLKLYCARNNLKISHAATAIISTWLDQNGKKKPSPELLKAIERIAAQSR